MCYETITGYGYWFWGPFTGPGPISWTISQGDYAIDVFLFDQANFIQYQYDAQRPKPFQTNYQPLVADLDVNTVGSQTNIPLSATTNYYLVVDNTYIGSAAAAGTTNNAGQTVFTPNTFYYSISGVNYGTGYMGTPVSSDASSKTVSVVALLAAAATAVLLL